jgi:hypothetical protein
MWSPIQAMITRKRIELTCCWVKRLSEVEFGVWLDQDGFEVSFGLSTRRPMTPSRSLGTGLILLTTFMLIMEGLASVGQGAYILSLRP